MTRPSSTLLILALAALGCRSLASDSLRTSAPRFPAVPSEARDEAGMHSWLDELLFRAEFEERDPWTQERIARAYAGEALCDALPAPDFARADEILAAAIEQVERASEGTRQQPALRELTARMLLLRGRLAREGGPGLARDEARGLALMRQALVFDRELASAAVEEAQGALPLDASELAAAIPATPGRRVALVVGNALYRHAPALETPEADARLLASTLEELGFEVSLRTNQDSVDLRLALEDFGNRTVDATLALFFYSGHGLQVDGVNYLVPVDTQLASERDLSHYCLPLEHVLVQFDQSVHARFVILDAARENPLAASLARTGATRDWGQRGLTVSGKDAQETLIAYSTAPGATTPEPRAASTSPYAAALVRRLREPEVEVSRVFRLVRDDVRSATQGAQVPWETSSLGARGIYLAGGR